MRYRYSSHILWAALAIAQPDPVASLPAPPAPRPEPFATAKGFGATLEPYKDQLSAEERAALQRYSETILASAAGDAVKRASRSMAAWLAELNKTNEAYRGFEGPELFTYAIPNDPLLFLGTAKSFMGPITTPPRLKRGAFEPPIKDPADKQGMTVSDDNSWIYDGPTKLCTRSLFAGLQTRMMYAELETFPIVDGDFTTHAILTSIENTPNPIVLSNRGNEALAPPPSGAAETGPAAPGETAEVAPEAGPEATPQPDPAPETRSFPELRKQEMPLAEFVPALQRAVPKTYDSPFRHVANELPALVPLIPAQRDLCAKARGKFREARWTDDGYLTLFSCELEPGKYQGLGARLPSDFGDSFMGLSVFYEDAALGLGVELAFEIHQDKVRLAAYRGDDYFGPSLQWNAAGQPTLLDFLLPASVQAKYGEYDVFEWHENGKLKFLGHRKAGQKAGLERSWYDSGALAGEVRFDDQGRPTSYKEWYENRRPAEDTALVDGEMNGKRRWWHQNGQPAGELDYVRGAPSGPFTLWYDDGRPGTRGSFKDGQLHGRLVWTFEDGGTLYEGNFVKGAPDGPHKLYRPNGGILSERSYKQGEPEGSWQSYGKDGKVMTDAIFAKGRKTGRATLSYPNGQPFVEVPFQDGLIDGVARSFFPDGQLAATCTYDKDRLASFVRYFKTGETQLEGKVHDAETGAGEFTAMTKAGQPTVSCQTDAQQATECKIYGANGDELRIPTDAELARTAQSPSGKKLSWRPARCGGATKSMNVDPLLDAESDHFYLDFVTKENCKAGDASILNCILRVKGNRIEATEPCHLGSYDSLSSFSREILSDFVH